MDRRLILLLAAAITLGLAGGYAWSSVSAPPQRAYVPPKATIADIAAAPEDYPAAVDDEWATRGGNPQSVADRPNRTVTASSTVYYSGCNEVRAAGKAPLYQGDPGYRPEMDGDADGIACEPIRRR